MTNPRASFNFRQRVIPILNDSEKCRSVCVCVASAFDENPGLTMHCYNLYSPKVATEQDPTAILV